MAKMTRLKASVGSQVVELNEHMQAAASKSSDGTLQADEKSKTIETILSTLDRELTELSKLNNSQMDHMKVIHTHIDKIIEDTESSVCISMKRNLTSTD